MIRGNVVGGRKVACPSRSTLRKWADMTDRNLHPEVRILIAKYFGDRERLEAFKKILAYSDAGEMPPLGLGDKYGAEHLFSDITYGLLRDIEYVFGEEVAGKVRRCL